MYLAGWTQSVRVQEALKTSSCSIRCPPGFDSWFAALRYLFNDTVFLDSSLLLVCFCMLTIFFSYTLSTIQLTFLLSTLNLTPFPLGYLPSSFISTLLSQSVCTFLSALNHLLIFFSCKISISSLEKVGSFKYLGVLLKPNLSWTLNLFNLKAKKKTPGLIYQHFYKHCTPDTLMLYKTLVRPILESVQFSGILPPHQLLPFLNQSNILPLKLYQNFGLRLTLLFLSNLNLNT